MFPASTSKKLPPKNRELRSDRPLGQRMLMKKNPAVARISASVLLAVAVTCAVLVAADWPSQSGGPQRDGWARYEKVFTKENVSGLDLLYTYKSDNQSKGLYSLTSPLIDGLLITFRGFKEMLDPARRARLERTARALPLSLAGAACTAVLALSFRSAATAISTR
jgi:hypothetical protein